MKSLISFLLISSSVHAVTLSQFRSTPDASSVQTFDVSAKKAEYKKASNFFDTTKNFTLGEFETAAKKIPQDDLKKLDEMITKIKNVDKFMKTKGEDFNSLSQATPHKSIFILNNYKISQESSFYPEIKKIFDHLLELDWKQVSGVKITDDFKTQLNIKDGKEMSKEPLSYILHCSGPEVPTICQFKDLGVLFLR